MSLPARSAQKPKVTLQPPQGLLQHLPIPHRPWSHIALDFVTGLPTSNHNTTILTIIDRFSKAVHFVPLTKLPSASETAHLLIQRIVRLHRIPTDIVSDRGPQFSAWFWMAFCTLLGISVSLSSGFHTQSNGQTKRANQSLETVLRCLCANNPVSWSSQLPWSEYAIISHTSSKMSPSSAAWCTNLPCSPARRRRWESPQPKPSYRGVSTPVALHRGHSYPGGLPEISTMFRGPIHHPEGHQPYGSSPQTTCDHEASTSYIPHLQTETCYPPPLVSRP